MTVLSAKKTPNSNKDSSSNHQQQQQASTSTRACSSRDDEQSNEISPSINLNDDSDELNRTSSNSLATVTDDLRSTIRATSKHFTKKPKRKLYYHPQHVPCTANNLIRQRRTSNEGCLETNTTGTSSNEDDSSDNVTSSSIITIPNQILDETDQCNSEDEYDTTMEKYDRNKLNELEIRFAMALKEKYGFVIKPVQEDGACLFRAISDQVFGDEEMHSTVRQNCIDYIVKNADFFREYITEDFDQYITRKRQENCHGNHIEMIALSEIYNRPIEVYEYNTEPINIVHGMYKTDNEPIRLSYHCGIHYNSVVDPWKPTAGHGLGLPNLEPGRAQESLMTAALRQSEESHIERAMLEDKLAATDWEATQDEIMQQIARESYLQWLCDTNQQQTDDNTASSSTASLTTSDGTPNIIQISSGKMLLPLRLDERQNFEFPIPFRCEGSTSSNANLDDDTLMQQVLALSQIEHVENLKQQNQPQQETSDSNDPN